jgi:phage terminase large subunit
MKILTLERMERDLRAKQREIWAKNPILYFEQRLGVLMYDKLAEILESVRDNPLTLVYSANGVGKTHLAGGLPVWWLECFDPSVVLITGSSFPTIKNTILPRTRNYLRTAEVFEREPNKTELWLSDTHFLTARTATDPENIAGVHSPNLLQIVEESSGVDDAIFSAMQGNATGNNSRQVHLGNPLRPTGKFYENIRNKAGKVIQISAFDHPNVKEGREIIVGAITRENIERTIERSYRSRPVAPHTPGAIHLFWKPENEGWYMPSNEARSRILGEFPAQSETSMFSETLLRAAAKRSADGWETGESSLALGCDVARYGGDETVLAIANDKGIVWMQALRDIATTETAGRITSLANQYPLAGIGVDEGGVGAGVVDILRENNITTMGLNFANASYEPTRYANIKAEMYFAFKDALETKADFTLPDDEELIRQAADVNYVIDSKGRYQIEKKESVKKRTGKSPDRLEAVIIAWYVHQYYAGGGFDFSAYTAKQQLSDENDMYIERDLLKEYGVE